MPAVFTQLNRFMATLSALAVCTKLAAARERRLMAKTRIGIYAGTFDPVHAGHIGLALQALKAANLDQVYFLPERRPRSKPDIEHFGHRTAMITRAIRPYNRLGLLELPDAHFDIKRTLPKLKQQFKNAHLFMVMGGDVAMDLPTWLDAKMLLANCELIVGLRGKQTKQAIVKAFKQAGFDDITIKFVTSTSPDVSSKKVRSGLRLGHPVRGLLASVKRYSKTNWLYISLSNSND